MRITGVASWRHRSSVRGQGNYRVNRALGAEQPRLRFRMTPVTVAFMQMFTVTEFMVALALPFELFLYINIFLPQGAGAQGMTLLVERRSQPVDHTRAQNGFG
jgi:hypothetical protein